MQSLYKKLGVFAKVWLILGNKPEISPNPNLGIKQEELEEKIKKSSEEIRKELRKILRITSLGIIPIQIGLKNFIYPSKVEEENLKEVSYRSNNGEIKIEEYQPEETTKSSERKYKIEINLEEYCNIGLDEIKEGTYELEGKNYRINVYRPEKIKNKLRIKNSPLEAIPEILFALLYKPKRLIQVKGA